jgi:hypothetical protein
MRRKGKCVARVSGEIGNEGEANSETVEEKATLSGDDIAHVMNVKVGWRVTKVIILGHLISGFASFDWPL